MSVVDAKPLVAINSIPFALIVAAAVAGLRPAFVAGRAQSPRAARRDRRYDWQESEPAPHRDRRSVGRSIRDAPRRSREMRHPAWRNLSWSTIPFSNLNC